MMRHQRQIMPITMRHLIPEVMDISLLLLHHAGLMQQQKLLTIGWTLQVDPNTGCSVTCPAGA